MIKRLQRKFVLIAALCLLAVEILIIGGINAVNIYQISLSEDRLLQLISDNGGTFPELGKRGSRPLDKPDGGFFMQDIDEETKYATRFFSVYYDSTGNVRRVDISHVAAVTAEQAEEYADKACAEGKEKGYIGSYKYCVSYGSGGEVGYVFLDCRSEAFTKRQFLLISCLIGAAGYVIVCLLIIIFSKRAIGPVVKSAELQRQFITDAGHEIKTPLAIISANTDVIEMTDGSSQWTQSIKNQIKRLDGLVKNLLSLSRMEEDAVQVTFSDFDLSDAVIDAAAPFEALARANGLSLVCDIEEGLVLHGDEGAVRQLVSVLAENAVKYSDRDGEIRIELYRGVNGKCIKLRVSNPCENPPEGDLSRLFDRFRRGDSSRSRAENVKGGYGIGLSIAKAVMEAHKGRITCKAQEGRIFFTAVFKSAER